MDINRTPKAELHYHLDCISAELCWRFTNRNHLSMPFQTEEECKALYRFTDFRGFARVVGTAIASVRTEEDVFDLVVACAEDMTRQNIVYREAMFDYPACFSRRGIEFSTVVSGLEQGLSYVRRNYPQLELCFIANMDRTALAEDNLAFLGQLAKARGRIPVMAIGLDNQESGYPAYRQEAVFKRAREMGFFLTAHAGETEGPSSIWDTLCSLKVDRLDHGIRAAESAELMDYLAYKGILLTLCPDSNISLGIYQGWEAYPLRTLLEHGVKVCINSDDPPYYHYDLNGNLGRLLSEGMATEAELGQMLQNAFDGRFQ